MTRVEYLLTCLAEECCEVGQRVSKALRFGLKEVQSGQTLTNAERIEIELVDLVTIAKILTRENFRSDLDYFELEDKKLKNLEKYMKYAKRMGTVDEDSDISFSKYVQGDTGKQLNLFE